jgi:hypothetical protein
MKTLRPHHLGLVTGSFIGLWHTFWSLLVLVGFAQPLLDFVFRLHMITPAYHVAAFSWANALGLIVITWAVGYVFGNVLGLLWNRLASGGGGA